jgi:hypothetical protein
MGRGRLLATFVNGRVCLRLKGSSLLVHIKMGTGR